jgi:hypothetical protein
VQRYELEADGIGIFAISATETVLEVYEYGAREREEVRNDEEAESEGRQPGVKAYPSRPRGWPRWL